MSPSESPIRGAQVIDPDTLPVISVLGPTIRFISRPDDERSPCVMRGTIPPNVVVPLHSHADPETFFALSGTVDALTERDGRFQWITLQPGSIFHVPGGAKHAFRNTGREPAESLVISTGKIGRFFLELGVPVEPGAPPAGRPTQQDIERFLETSARYGYWNATPEENARVGLQVPGF